MSPFACILTMPSRPSMPMSVPVLPLCSPEMMTSFSFLPGCTTSTCLGSGLGLGLGLGLELGFGFGLGLG